MSEPGFGPARRSGAAALLAGVAVVLVCTGSPPPVLGVAAGGMLALAAGVVRGTRGWLAVGAVGLVAGVLLASLAGASSLSVLAGAPLALVAWDLGEHAVGLGEQVGREASTARGEAVHAGSSLGVGVVAVGVALAAGGLSVGPLPLPAFLVGLLASIVLVVSLRT